MTDKTKQILQDHTQKNVLLSDTPVKHPSQDRLGRALFAKQLVESILALDASDGFVFALNGPWGSGKTTVLNFVQHYLNDLENKQRVVVLTFNPWWFSDQEQLLIRFFREFRLSLGKKDVPIELQKIGESLERLGTILEPLELVPFSGKLPRIASWILRASGVYIQSGAKTKKDDVYSLRSKIDKDLKNQKVKILVIIDDIDRLTADDIRVVFQLVKSVADFPNTIYLLAFDRTVVENSLNKIQGGTGGDYIEKIVQVPFDLPPIGRICLHKYLFERLDPILTGTPDNLWSQTEWGNIFFDGIGSCLVTLRDVKRFINLLQCSYPPVKGEVRPAEFIGMQTLRLFVPDIFTFIHEHKELFAGTQSWEKSGIIGRNDEKKKYAENILNLAPENMREPVNQILTRLFPLWSQAFGGTSYTSDWLRDWRKECRVCSPDVIDRYFMLGTQPDELSNKEMRRILDLPSNTNDFSNELLRLSKIRRLDGISQIRAFVERMEDYTRKDIPSSNIPNILRSLFCVGDQLSAVDELQGPFDSDNRMRLKRIIFQLVSRYKTQNERFTLLKDAMVANQSISLICHYIATIGDEYGKFTKEKNLKPEPERTISADHLKELESLGIDMLKKAKTDGTLQKAHDFIRLLFIWRIWQSDVEPKEYVRQLIQNDEGFTVYIKGFLSKTHSWGFDDRVSKTQWKVDIQSVQLLSDASVEYLVKRAESILKQSPKWLDNDGRLALETLVHDVKKPRDQWGDTVEDE